MKHAIASVLWHLTAAIFSASSISYLLDAIDRESWFLLVISILIGAVVVYPWVRSAEAWHKYMAQQTTPKGTHDATEPIQKRHP